MRPPYPPRRSSLHEADPATLMLSLNHFLDLAERPLGTWPGAFVVAAIAVAVAVGVHRIGARILTRIARPYPLMSVVLRYVDAPALILLVFLGIGFMIFEAPDSLPFIGVLRDVETVALIGALTFLAVRSAG